MAFLLIVQVPYERDDKNKLEQEIRKLSTDAIADNAKSDDETDNDKEAELERQDTIDNDSSFDKKDKEESQDKTDEEKVKTNETGESSQEEKDPKKQELKNYKKESENKTEDNASAAEGNEINPNENDNNSEVNETKQVENETKAGTNTAEDCDNQDEEPKSTDKTPDENPETVNDTASSKVQANVNETPSTEQDNVAESASSNEQDSANEASSKEQDKEEVKDNEESTPEKGNEDGDDNDNDDTATDSDTKADDENKHHAHLTPLLPALPLYKIAEDVLISLEVDNYEMTMLGKKNEKYIWFSFIEQDSLRCETILNKLKAHGVGRDQGSSVSVFPASLHECSEDNSQSSPEGQQVLSVEQQQEESQFKKSIKSRLVVAQVVASVRSNAMFTFDYLLLLCLASVIACLGLAENSSVVLVASMLISPLMGPILAGTFGHVIKAQDLRNLGVKSELAGLSLCVIVGFLFGLISGGIGLHGALWGSTEEWPTAEMKSRGMLRSLWVGVFIALPSGAGVAISVLGGNAGSLVGVAISASLLPPACNAGMLWAYAFLAAISPPSVIENSVIAPTTLPTNTTILSNATTSTPSITSTISQLVEGSSIPESCLPLVNNAYRQVYSCNVANDAALLGLISLLLTLLNITCILIMGILVLKIKEVAPKTAGSTSSVDNFWVEDVKVARTYYQTSKGQQSNELGKQFLNEWQKIKGKEKIGVKPKEKLDDIEEESGDEIDEDDVSLSGQMDTINIFNYISEVENSSTIQHVLSRLSPSSPQEPVSSGLFGIYNQATADLEHKLSRRPAVYLSEAKVKDKLVNNVYHTIHAPADVNKRHKPTLSEMRNRLTRPSQSLYFDTSTLEMINETGIAHPDSSTSGLLKRRRKKVKFEVTKVEEQALLP